MKGGGVLFVGIAGPDLARREREILRRLRPAGIVLVNRNIAELPRLESLLEALRHAAPDAIFCLDAEGGRVDRLRGIVAPAPAAADLARVAPRYAESAGRWLGEELRRFGFDLDFAPVVDLDHGRVKNALDRRCFGATPRAVASRARAFLRGLHAAGIGATLKHFPGLGDAREDTHRDPSRIDRSRRALARDLAPFASLGGEAEAVMLGHAIYPAWDRYALPATVSRAIGVDLLRRRLKYRGAALSDDLEMGALAPLGDLADRCESALAAGCDGLLVCKTIEATPAIAARLALPKHRARLREAERRIERLRGDLARLKRRAIGPPRSLEELRHRFAALAESIATATARQEKKKEIR